jgi:DNA modification methylase
MSFEIKQGDALSVLRDMPDQSVQTCVTSPPYYGLRDYGIDGQIGLEETPAEYVARLVAVFAEVRRVLRPDGICWVNLGDSYAGSGRGGNPEGSPWAGFHGSKDRERAAQPQRKVNALSLSRSLIEKGAIGNAWVKPPAGYKQKDLMGIPWRVAFALQDDGWWLRQDIIWHKPNPMPESVTDRCTKSHEYIFLLSKSAKYYFDQEAIKEPLKDASVARLIQDVESQNGSDRVPGKTNGAMKAVRFGGNKYGDSLEVETRTKSGNEWKPKGRDRSNGNRNGEGASTLDKKVWTPDQAGSGGINSNGRSGYFFPDGTPVCGASANKKSVWTVTTQPFKEAHFATFPPKLVEPMVLAGSREGDTVLDPFNGAGTTGLVSLKHRRNYIGIELNPEYIKISEKRLAEVQVNLF